LLDKITEQYQDGNFLIADGFDNAIIGIDEKSMRLIYSVSECINILSKKMSDEESLEYFEFNIAGAYIGKSTPI